MISFVKPFRVWLLLISLGLIFLLGLKYRLRNYWDFPPVGQTFDEQLYSWVGSSLINTGIPTGWSFIPGYPITKSVEMNLDGYTTHMTLVTPFIEQPPLAGLLSSLLSQSYRLPSFDRVTLKQIRLPAIIISSLSLLLLFIYISRAYNSRAGLLTTAIFAFTPTVIISHRLATAENYLSFFLLLGLICLQQFIIRRRKKYLLFTVVLSIVCYLIKPFGLILPFVFFMAVLVFGLPKINLIWPVLSAIAAHLLFTVYGNFYQPVLFSRLVSFQTARLFSPLGGLLKIILPRITQLFLDGWIVFGWLSFFVLAVKNHLKTHFWIVVPVIGYLLFFTLYGGEDYGWYRLLLYPFLSASAGLILYSAFRQKSSLVPIIFIITVFTSSFWWGLFTTSWVQLNWLFRGIMIISAGYYLLHPYFPKLKNFYLPVSVLLVCGVFFLNIRTVNHLQAIWQTLGNDSSLIPFRK